MSGRLIKEIKQSKPFKSLEVEAILNILKTADVLTRRTAEAMKPYDLSPTQYNALRILRGAGNDGLPCSEIAERMINKDPDITRLMDRLEQRGLVTRARDKKDRRVVTGKISPKGLKLLDEMDQPLADLEKRQLGMGEKDLLQLIALLETAREHAERE
jgi:DNA-binding MarR family transcriptional regulator